MKSRNLIAGVVVLTASLFAGVTSASASGTSSSGTCVIHSLPSFVAQGEFEHAATVADIVEVECDPTVYGTGSTVTITASQLFSRCNGKLVWFVPNSFATNEFKREPNGLGVTVQLDADGNATVALLAGGGCAAGESLVTAHMKEKPFETVTTSFTVLPPHDTTPGVFALPSRQVEDDNSSSVATIIQAEFANASEEKIRIGSEELFARCQIAPHVRWIKLDGTEVEVEDEGEAAGGPADDALESASEVKGLELDNNGNTFVIAIGDKSCAEGPSLIEADLESKPFTTYTTTFTTEGPRPTI